MSATAPPQPPAPKPDPVLLDNGDVLVPVRRDGGDWDMVPVHAGDEDHAFWVARAQSGRPRPADTSGGGVLGKIIAVAAVIAVALWFGGALDKPLSNVGLNKNPCVQNAFGATFCGDDAKRLCEQFGGPACGELGYSETGSYQRELDEALEDLGGP